MALLLLLNVNNLLTTFSNFSASEIEAALELLLELLLELIVVAVVAVEAVVVVEIKLPPINNEGTASGLVLIVETDEPTIPMFGDMDEDKVDVKCDCTSEEEEEEEEEARRSEECSVTVIDDGVEISIPDFDPPELLLKMFLLGSLSR